ncbi:ribonucleoside-diphosphate reductase subunit alpha [Vibrio phage C-ZP2022]|nr:ribonucleoside-diphosphate reductase subunit alpha [Vibrio phage C-ZP2022]
MLNINVTKRLGVQEKFTEDKVSRVVDWAAEGLHGVSASAVIMKASIDLYDGIPTTEIHEALIMAAVSLITKDAPDYQILAGRLKLFEMRKEAFGGFEPPTIRSQVERMVTQGRYDHTLLEHYTPEQLDELETIIDHSRDLNIGWAGMAQLRDKYVVQDRNTGEIFESPQFIYLLVGATLFSAYPHAERMEYIRKFYEVTSSGKVSLPTPIMAGVRTSLRQFSSCVVIESDDSILGIGAATTAIMVYVAKRAGIGINFGAIRPKGSPIRDGSSRHTGVTQFIKLFEAATNSCSQGGIRNGSATAFYPFFHRDARDFLVLKNNRGTDETRARDLDYSLQGSRFLLERIRGEITLFDTTQIPEVVKAFFSDDYEEFKRLYEAAENNPLLKDTSVRVNTLEFMTEFLNERSQTGRYYWFDANHANSHGPFDPEKAPVRQSNLCLEIALPTKPLKHSVHDENAEIALCTLSAFNWLELNTEEDFKECADIVIRALDDLLSYQDYPLLAAQRSVDLYRPLGVGIINYAADMAKNGWKYGEQAALDYTHRKMEMMQFYLMSASVQLAKEFGRCEGFDNLRYAKGQMVIDTYCKNVDQLTSEPLHMDWEGLRADIAKYGIRNATVTALMPSETSSQVCGATNGIEPPRREVTTKTSKSGPLKLVVPLNGIDIDAYTYAWEMPNNTGYLYTVAVLQKFVDQAISANTYYVPSHFPNGKVPVKRLLADLALAVKFGLKTLYYHNTQPQGEDRLTISVEKEDESCSGGGCKI